MAEIGSTEAIRDWFNASFYNKEEIDNLFIQNNQQGLIPYDLTIVSDVPNQFVKLVGQTSGKVYQLSLEGIIIIMGINFSLIEQKTGQKWIDGKDVYQLTVAGDTKPASGTVFVSGVDELIHAFGSQLFVGNAPHRYYDFPYTSTDGPRTELNTVAHELTVIYGNSANFTKYRWTFQYTKV